MTRSSLSKCILPALFLCLGAGNVSAQEQEMSPPPLPNLGGPAPPNPNSLPPPPPLEWTPISTGPSEGEPNSVFLPAALFVPPSAAVVQEAPAAASNCGIFVAGQRDPGPFELATPQIEIWRNGAETPESPMQIKEGVQSAMITSGNPVWIRLLFDPSLTGTAVSVTPSEGVIIQPAQITFYIGASGECLLLVDLDAHYQEGGEITFYSQQITTGLRLAHATPETIEALASP